MRRRLAAAALAATLVLSGCGTQDDYPAPVADRLQDTVLQVSTYASTGQLDQALAALDELERRLDAARASGQISEERYEDVKAAIAAVRTKIEEQRADTATPAPNEGEEPAAGTGDGEEEAPADPAPDAPAPEPAPEEPAPEAPPAEEPPAEEPPAEDPPAEEPPAEDPPAEEPPADEPPADDPPTDEEPPPASGSQGGDGQPPGGGGEQNSQRGGAPQE